MNFKNIETHEEWADAVALRNIFNWSHPVSTDDERIYAEDSRKTRNDARIIAVEGDEIVAYGKCMFNRNAGSDGNYWIDIMLDPHHEQAPERLVAMERRLWQQMLDFGGNTAQIEVRGEYEWVLQAFENLGFSRTMNLPYSGIDLSSTDFSLEESVISMQEYLDQHPESGLHDLWRLEMDVASDLPLPYPFVETPFEVFQGFVMSEVVDRTSKFVLYEDGVLKGMSQLWPSKVNPALAATGLTGVRRDYRRQKVATRLKQHAIAWAKSKGVERIFTDNEENNPMYQLNLQLGFRRLFDYVVYSKSC